MFVSVLSTLYQQLLSNLYSDVMLSTAVDTFKILVHSAVFFPQGTYWHIQSYSVLLRHIHAYLDIFKANSGSFRHIQHPALPYHIHNLVILWALAYLEPKACLKPCEILTSHIQNPLLVIRDSNKTVWKIFCFRFHLILIKVYIFAQQKAWILWI